MPKFTSLSLSQAQEKVIEVITPKTESLFVPTMESEQSILATDIYVKKNLPSFDNSAMDGFAFLHSDKGKKLKIVSTVFAGEAHECKIKEGECCKIMTGAKVPEGIDTIAPIENCSDVTAESVVVPENINLGDNLRKKGEELEAGEILFHKGEIVTAAHIALLASQGITTIEVVAPLNIAIVSTGDELKEPWEQANEDEIYNANAFGIKSLLQQFGFKASYIGSIPDDLEQTIQFLSTLKSYDVVITTGGISMGDADFLYQAYVANGLESIFHGVNVKPGRPTMMGKMGTTLVMAMPGNPLTTMLNVFTLSIPALFKKQGATNCYHTPLYAKSAKELKLRSGRDNMVLGSLENGIFTPTRDNKIGSGMLSPLVESNAIAYFADNVEELHKDQFIKIVLLEDITRAYKINSINF
ncbi:molybdopterin molybdotransferase MoeA [Sulfurimonas microaerophilic]|uniref:molybdopterin molybdotransferase MoeA n=1 Tax=Sulfurimonas microaerophilic TaxID=3058392 RepID=UPI0027152F6C|nr:molybdopterin molybdotransferase MoeA [Sulfurimonas sp. hsl 1-7]